jgi:hypothetical protein
MSQESLDIPAECGLIGLGIRISPIDAEMSAEPMPFDCERIVFLRLRAAHHDEGVTYE